MLILFVFYVRPWLSVVFTCRVRHAFQDSPNAGVPLNTRVAPPMIPPPAFPPSSSQMGFTPGSIPPGFMASAPMGIGPPGIPPPFIPPYNMNMPGKYRDLSLFRSFYVERYKRNARYCSKTVFAELRLFGFQCLLCVCVCVNEICAYRFFFYRLYDFNSLYYFCISLPNNRTRHAY